VKLVSSRAGAAALACLDLIVSLGLPMRNVFVSDSSGVVYAGRKELMDPNKARYAQHTEARKLAEIIEGGDIFLGLSAGGVLKPEMVKVMARDPIILAMANPTPEIFPEEALAARPDAILGTGRSDYPNQVNNVLCFPFIFRGALDVGASTINEEMKLAAVRAIAGLAHAEIPEVVAQAYGAVCLRFGAQYLIPEPFDPRLIEVVAPAVAQAAVDSGVATRPIFDMSAYRERLSQFVYRSGSAMQPVFAAAKRSCRRVVFAEGEDERVLRAAQVVIDGGIAQPLLVGRPQVIAERVTQLGLRLAPGTDCEVINPLDVATYTDAAREYHRIARRRGRLGGNGMHRDAKSEHLVSSHACETRKGRRDALRHLRSPCGPPCLCARRDLHTQRNPNARHHANADVARASTVHLRHPREPRPERPADC